MRSNTVKSGTLGAVVLALGVALGLTCAPKPEPPRMVVPPAVLDSLAQLRDRALVLSTRADDAEHVARALADTVARMRKRLVLVPLVPPTANPGEPGNSAVVPAAPDTVAVPQRVLDLVNTQVATIQAYQVTVDTLKVALSLERQRAEREKALREDLAKRLEKAEAQRRPRFGFGAGFITGALATGTLVLVVAFGL